MALKINSVNLNSLENSKNHFTDNFEILYDSNGTVLRRGQTFKISIQFDGRDYNQEIDKITLSFGIGQKPSVTKNTLGMFPLLNYNKTLRNDYWNGKIISYHNKILEAEIISPSHAPFGTYTLKIECKNGNSINHYKHPTDIWLLFNPWIKEDLVYFPDRTGLLEYILCDIGKIWLGPQTSTRGREWVYEQFASYVLPACVMMLDRVKLSHQNRGDPIKIARAISKIVNSNDDHGVVVGRWDGEYDDGVPPYAWTGSGEILEKFYTTGEEVRYGQCWVFSGVVTTVCRAIGIPSRPVSNLVSAHDTNASLTVDKYFDKNNKELDYDPNAEGGEDSVWNYHVWNDVYMARPDLRKEFGGWQAIDATPQETSDGFYQCGPASVEAIRRGEIGLNYDVPFMLSSVNADRVNWKEDARCPLGYKRILCNTYHIGKMILTKKAGVFDHNGDKDREDITLLYKHKEGTPDERESLFNAARQSRSAKKFFEMPEESNDVKFNLNDLEKIDVGNPFISEIRLKNTSNQNRTIELSITATSMYYNGKRAKVIKRIKSEVQLPSHKQQTVRMTVKPEEYLDALVEYNNIKISVFGTVLETMQNWIDEDDFQIIKPSLKIILTPEIKVGQTQKINMTFTNPLPQILKDGYFTITVPKLLARSVKIQCGHVPQKGTAYANYEIPMRRRGTFNVVAAFTSKQLSDVTGSASFEIK